MRSTLTKISSDAACHSYFIARLWKLQDELKVYPRGIPDFIGAIAICVPYVASV